MPQHWERLSALRLVATAQRRHSIKPMFHGAGAAMPQGTAALRHFCGAPTFLRRSDIFASLRHFHAKSTLYPRPGRAPAPDRPRS
jgi:hypothetical protein